MSTAQRAVLITGCSSGIGLCAAQTLPKHGYRVFATARKPEDVAALRAQGVNALSLDLDSSASIAEVATEVLRQTEGKLYALVNNAGFGLPGAVEDLSRAALRAQFETNVFGTQELTNRLLPAMRLADEGRVIQISSLLGIVNLPYRGAYSASKFALEALSNTLRLELRGTNIHVVLIEPGPIQTEFRGNSHAAYKKWLDTENSPHRQYYANVESRLVGETSSPFTAEPADVVAEIIRALDAPRPTPRYPVTVPAKLFSLLRRILSDRTLDRLLMRVSGGGKR